jgi:hypothetical protein
MHRQSMQVRNSFRPVAAVVLVLLASILVAKPAAVTLAELVHESPVIVFGRLEVESSSVPKPGAGLVPFKSSRVFRKACNCRASALSIPDAIMGKAQIVPTGCPIPRMGRFRSIVVFDLKY